VPIRPETHRPRGAARREALLRAAVELVAEYGVAGVTHRAVAARAGVPASTTSYFFASIDDLVLEALREFAERRVTMMEAMTEALAERSASPDEVVETFVDVLIGAPDVDVVAQFEAYLEASRRADAAAAVHDVIAAFERLAEAALRAAGARRPREGARAFVALADGFALHRMAWPRGDADRRELEAACRALFAAYAGD